MNKATQDTKIVASADYCIGPMIPVITFEIDEKDRFMIPADFLISLCREEFEDIWRRHRDAIIANADREFKKKRKYRVKTGPLGLGPETIKEVESWEHDDKSEAKFVAVAYNKSNGSQDSRGGYNES